MVSIVVALAQVGDDGIALTLEKKTGIGLITHLLSSAAAWAAIAKRHRLCVFCTVGRAQLLRFGCAHANEVACLRPGFLGRFWCPETLRNSLGVAVGRRAHRRGVVVGASDAASTDDHFARSWACWPVRRSTSPLKFVHGGAIAAGVAAERRDGVRQCDGVRRKRSGMEWRLAVLTLAAFCVAIYYAPF